MKKLFAASVAFVLALYPALAFSHTVSEAFALGEGVNYSTSGTTGYNPILIKYIGTSPAGGTVTVDAATGDITLKTGPVGSSSADATTECPVSGAAGGVIDVSDAACNTLGEVVDAINASSNWLAVIQDGVRTDTSVNTLTTLAETSASKPQGLALAGDVTVSLQVTLALVPLRDDIRFYHTAGATPKLNPNPFADSQSILWYATQTLTGTGADTKQYIFSVPNNQACTLGASSISCSASEVKQSVSFTGPGSTNNGTIDFSQFGIWGPKGGRLLVRGEFATTLTAVTLFGGAGHVFPYKTGRR